jgi:ureidoglycolate lyase
MKTIKIEQLTAENFFKFGTFQNMLDTTKFSSGGAFCPDMLRLDSGGKPLAISANSLTPNEPIIKFYEYHANTGEGILPIDGDVIMYVGPSARVPNPDKLRAFYLPRGTFVCLHQGTVHGSQFVIGNEPVHVAILLPERTYANDFFATRLEEKDWIKIER